MPSLEESPVPGSIRSTTERSRCGRFPRLRTGSGRAGSRMRWLMLLAMLAACRGVSPQVIPDPTVPHQLSREVGEAWIWVRIGATDKWSEQKVTIPKGFWIAGPPVIQPLP
jgi:hypothetical protein